MSVAHFGVGLFIARRDDDADRIKIEKDIALAAGRDASSSRAITSSSTACATSQGPNYQASKPTSTIYARRQRIVTVLHPQKRVYRVQQSPMTEAGIEVGWTATCSSRSARSSATALEPASAVQAAGALHLAGRDRDGARRLHRRHRPALPHARAAEADQRGPTARHRALTVSRSRCALPHSRSACSRARRRSCSSGSTATRRYVPSPLIGKPAPAVQAAAVSRIPPSRSFDRELRGRP